MSCHPRQTMTLLGVALVGLQLLLSGASSWHQHDDHRSPDQHHDCSVCVAVDMMGQATFETPALVESAGRVELVPDRVIHLVSRGVVARRARGPPAQA